MLTARRITYAVILGITFVFALAGWRLFTGETEKVANLRPAAPVAKPLAVAAVTTSEAPSTINQVELSQQLLVDDLQLLERRYAKQELELKRLRAELEALTQKYDALASIASTQKEVKPEPAVRPIKKKKKRYVKRSRSGKKGAKA